MTYTVKHVVDCSTGETQEVALTPDEIAAIEAKDAEWAAGQTARDNDVILRQIAAIETVNNMPRPLRDLLLTNTTAPSYAKIKAIDDQITALRGGLKNA